MSYSWYKVFNKIEFEATGAFSSKLNVILTGIGQREVLITQGNTIGVTYEGTLLPVGFFGANPYTRDGKAVYLDTDQNVWLGIET